MMRTTIGLMMLLSTVALAHGGGHLMGVVSAIGEKQITVTAEDKDKVLVAIDGDTRYENDGKAATAKDLSVGARVVVQLKPQSMQPLAVLVKFMAPAQKGARLEVSVTSAGFLVSNPVPLKAGEAVTLVVTRTVEKTCATDIVLKDYGISQPLPLNQAVEVTFTPTKPGKVHFACAMGAIGGDLKVE